MHKRNVARVEFLCRQQSFALRLPFVVCTLEQVGLKFPKKINKSRSFWAYFGFFLILGIGKFLF